MKRLFLMLMAVSTIAIAQNRHDVEDGSLSGVVRSGAGAPIRGAKVIVKYGQNYVARFTDAAGAYRVSGLPAGTLHVTAVTPGFTEQDKVVVAGSAADFVLKAEFDRNQLTSAEIASSLPKNRETDWLVARCVQCHGMTQAEHFRGADRASWLEIFATMQLNYGREEIKGPIAEYAADIAEKYFGPDSKITESSIKRTPVQDGALNATFRMIDLVPTGNRALAHSIVSDNQGGAWVSEAGNNRLTHWNPKVGMLKSYVMKEPGSFPHTPVVDKDGRVWTALLSQKTMSIIDPKTGQISYLPLLSSPHTLSVDADNQIWGNGSKIYRVNARTNETSYWTPLTMERGPGTLADVFHVPTMPKPEPGPLDPYHAVRDSKGTLWYTSFEVGSITSLNPATGEQKHVAVDGVSSSRGMAIAADDTIWFSDWLGHRLVHYNPVLQKSELFNLPNANGMIYSVFIDPKRGYIWCSDYAGNNLTRFDPRTKTFIEFPLPFNESYPRFISIDNNGLIWFAEWWNNRIGVMDPGID